MVLLENVTSQLIRFVLSKNWSGVIPNATQMCVALFNQDNVVVTPW